MRRTNYLPVTVVFVMIIAVMMCIMETLSTTPTAPHTRTGLFVSSRRTLYLAVPQRDGRDPEIREYRLDR